LRTGQFPTPGQDRGTPRLQTPSSRPPPRSIQDSQAWPRHAQGPGHREANTPQPQRFCPQPSPSVPGRAPLIHNKTKQKKRLMAAAPNHKHNKLKQQPDQKNTPQSPDAHPRSLTHPRPHTHTHTGCPRHGRR